MSVAKSLRYSTAQFVSNWERGVSLPPLDALPRLAGLFKASNREVIEAMMQYEERMLELHKKQLTQLFKSR